MFLSRARLRADSAVRAIAPLLLPQGGHARLLAGHRLVWSLMSDGPGRVRDFLWREEQPGSFLILAPRPARADGELFDVDSKDWAPSLRAGDRLGFLLRANPTIARSAGPGMRGKRHDVVMDALRDTPGPERATKRTDAIAARGAEWLSGQGARAGFVPDPERLSIDGYDSIKIDRPDAKPARFGRLEFDGVLRVADPAALVAAVAGGFGRARAFGCGLMLLRRV